MSCDCNDEKKHTGSCEYIEGNTIDINIEANDCEIKADITVAPAIKTVRVWGRVRECNGCPVEGALVKLVKETASGCDTYDYSGVAHGVTDCEGFYQFDVCDKCGAYKVIVSKSAKGRGRVILGGENCLSCKKEQPIQV